MDQKTWKERLKEEARLFVLLTVYLSFFLCSITIYRRLILAESAFSTFPYGYALIEAMILAKVILIGRMLKLGDRFSDQPLLIPVFYKSVVFTFFTFAFSVLEHALFDHIPFSRHGFHDALGKMPLCFSVFIALFSLLETARVIGGDKLYHLFTKKR